jgi:hypothetical protein
MMMSNQRVVVLTDDDIEVLALERGLFPSFRLVDKLLVALGHPGGITDEMKQRGGELLVGYTCHSEEAAEALVAEVLEAALFPGDGEQ